jgi:hypothetical protein
MCAQRLDKTLRRHKVKPTLDIVVLARWLDLNLFAIDRETLVPINHFVSRKPYHALDIVE